LKVFNTCESAAVATKIIKVVNAPKYANLDIPIFEHADGRCTNSDMMFWLIFA
jgi:hypothetical protein